MIFELKVYVLYYIIRAITLERLHIVTHSSQSRFQQKHVCMKLPIFFISRTKQIHTQATSVSKSIFEIKAMPAWMLFEILLTSAFIRKQ